MYQIFYTLDAQSDLNKIDKQIARRIIKKVVFFSLQTDPMKWAKPLSDPSAGQYRFRIGDYRVVFDTDQKWHINILVILRVGHRKDIYKK